MQIDKEEPIHDQIEPPHSASGFHRQKKEEIEISADHDQKTGTEGQFASRDNNQKALNTQQKQGCWKFFKLQYYKKYFDVSEAEVLSRIKASITIPPTEDFIERTNSKPDFYGPFWLLTTLIGLLGTVGNLSNYFLSKFSNEAVWQGYFFKLEYIRYAFLFLYVYGFGIPTAIYFLFKVFSKHLQLDLPDIICIYGYSLTPFLIAVVASIIPFSILQWILIMLAMSISSYFLFANLKNYCQKVKSIPLLGIIISLQLILALTFKLIFLNLLS